MTSEMALRCASLAILFVPLLGAPAAWAAPFETQICIDRPGENGSVNITPVTIEIRGEAELTILGEQEVCFRPHESGWSETAISLKFSNPYGDPRRPRQWRTKPIPVSLMQGKTKRLLLCEKKQNHNDPQWEKTGWHRMWILLSPRDAHLCAQ